MSLSTNASRQGNCERPIAAVRHKSVQEIAFFFFFPFVPFSPPSSVSLQEKADF